jgi:hypothetical protein
MRRLWLLAFAAGLWAACDVVSNLGADGLPSCDGGVCPDGGAPDAADDAGDSGLADTGTWDSGFDGGDGGCGTNCLGCCAGNTCIGYSSETSGQCGASGAACAPCGPDICDSGVCVPAADSGHPDGGSNDGGCGICSGCCNLSQCIQLSAETNLLCGHGGAACLPCLGDAGTCNTTTGSCG